MESTLNAAGFYARHGFGEIGRSTLSRNQVDVPVVVMEMPAKHPLQLVFRVARDTDEEFCFRVTREAMRSYVEATFGPWQDEAQRRYFEGSFTSIPHKIIVADGADAGLWSVAREPDRLVLKKAYLLPGFQRRGIGSTLLRRLIQDSKAARLPIELRYLKVNPVASLYERLGFRLFKEESPYVYVRRSP